jgi:hypothetical protein
MRMNPFEVFILFGAGYISGLSVSSGFILQALKKLFHSQWSGARETLWLFAMMLNVIICGPMTVLLFGMAVQDFNRPDFWPCALIFSLGLGVGLGFVFMSVHAINLGIKVYQHGLRN